MGWHSGSGNSKSVAIEICQNRGINQPAANERAAKLTALLLHELGINLAGNVVQHHDWTGKDCPKLLRHPASGWTSFLEMVARFHAAMEGAQHENEHAPLDLVAAHSAAPDSDNDPRDAGRAGAVQTNIVSTEFGGGSEAGMPSAYGGTIDPNQPQASLPARVPRSRMRILVTNPANGRSVACLVNDVGPWNIHDAYWDHGNRPAAEAQHRNHQLAENHRVPSNEAGLDLTPAAMLALGVNGPVNTRQVTVNWQFA